MLSKNTIKKSLLSALLLSLPLVASAAAPSAIQTLVNNIVDSFKYVGTAIVVIAFIVVGIMFLTAAGDPEKTKKAKSALIWAIVGTIVIYGLGALIGAAQQLGGV